MNVRRIVLVIGVAVGAVACVPPVTGGGGTTTTTTSTTTTSAESTTTTASTTTSTAPTSTTTTDPTAVPTLVSIDPISPSPRVGEVNVPVATVTLSGPVAFSTMVNVASGDPSSLVVNDVTVFAGQSSATVLGSAIQASSGVVVTAALGADVRATSIAVLPAV